MSILHAGEIGRLDTIPSVNATDGIVVYQNGTIYLPILTVFGKGIFDNTDFTENSVLFVGPSGVISEDNTNFTWDDTNDIFASRKITVSGQTNINLPADENVVIDGATNQRTVTVGAMRQLHTPAIPGTRALNYVVDINSQPDTTMIVGEVILTGLAVGEAVSGFQIDVDTANSTGGNIECLNVQAVGTGSASVHALHAGVDVEPIEQIAGAFGTIEQAWSFDDSLSSFTDVTAAFNSTGTDVQMFVENDDIIYVGNSSQFGALSFELAIVASNPGVKPTFEYWNGSAWTEFGPPDGTNGFRVNGTIQWSPGSLNGWVSNSVNGVSKFWVRIQRTANNLTTPPTEDIVKLAPVSVFEWDKNGDLTINEITIAGRVQSQDYTHPFLFMGG